ncbi:MAG TPA: hypothetical protein VHB79_33440 [Polyangiaceae bacterium]|nr:hypothetical protein [Polyangiaceae bacterium]
MRTSGFGVAYGAALGARWHEFTFAATYRRGDFSDWQLSTVCGELAMRFRLGAFVPHLGFGAGYAALTGAVADVSRTLAPDPPTAIEISGLNVRVSVGLDYYLLGWLSLGANLSGDAFFLRRHGDRLIRTSSTDVSSPPAFPYGLDGSGNGLGATLSVLLGLHY